MTMDLRTLCLISLRDAGIPIIYANRMTNSIADFDMAAQVMRRLFTTVCKSHMQECEEGGSSLTTQGLINTMICVDQDLRV